MKKLFFFLIAFSLPAFGEFEQPPFEVKDPAVSENFRSVYQSIDQLGLIRNESGQLCLDEPTFCVDSSTTSVYIDNNSALMRFRVDAASGTIGMISAHKLGLTAGGGVTRMEISADGEVTKPYQPSFLVNNTNRKTDVTGDGTAYTVAWDTEIFDQGGDFATNTFTAPVTGKYLLSCHLLSVQNTSSHNTRYLSIVTSNRSYTFEDQALTAGERGSSLTVIADMDIGDTAYVVFSTAGSTKVVDVYEGAFTYFSGSLIN